MIHLNITMKLKSIEPIDSGGSKLIFSSESNNAHFDVVINSLGAKEFQVGDCHCIHLADRIGDQSKFGTGVVYYQTDKNGDMIRGTEASTDEECERLTKESIS